MTTKKRIRKNKALTVEQKERKRAYRVAYDLKHRAERLAYHVAYNAAHQEEKRAYRLARAEERSAYDAIYRAAHAEDIRANRTARSMHTRDRRAALRAAHPEVYRAAWERRRALKAGAPVNDFTAAQWKAMQEHYDHRCVYCGKRAKGHLSQDHITPLSGGGSHTLANIVPACRSCNSRKGARAVLVPVQPLLLLVA